MAFCKELEEIAAYSNNIQEFPFRLLNLSKLRKLDLSLNEIAVIPKFPLPDKPCRRDLIIDLRINTLTSLIAFSSVNAILRVSFNFSKVTLEGHRMENKDSYLDYIPENPNDDTDTESLEESSDSDD